MKVRLQVVRWLAESESEVSGCESQKVKMRLQVVMWVVKVRVM